MAHPEQRDFIVNCLKRFAEKAHKSKNILEVGSQNINGSVKDYFGNIKDKNWFGLDLDCGKDVDFNIPGEIIQLPTAWADISISTECFEHSGSWIDIFKNMIRITKETGLIMLTFAGHGRPVHGTADTGSKWSPFTTDYYQNIEPKDLYNCLDLRSYFSQYSLEENSQSCDTYFWGIRSNYSENTETTSPEESLARARGQLNNIMIENKALKLQIQTLETSEKKLVKLQERFQDKGKTFEEVFSNQRTYIADKWKGYFSTYNEIMPIARDKSKNILEIGVNNGGTLEVLARYFKKSQNIVGIDINQKCQSLSFEDNRIKVHIGDATNQNFAHLLWANYDKFDLIIDDGSHKSEDIINTFFNFLPLLSEDSVYVIEDLCCDYWEGFGGGIGNPKSAINTLIKLVHFCNHEHWHTPSCSLRKVLKKIINLSPEKDCVDKLRTIQSISFSNSLCFMRFKKNIIDRTIGPRLCRGKAGIEGGFRPVDGQSIKEIERKIENSFRKNKLNKNDNHSSLDH